MPVSASDVVAIPQSLLKAGLLGDSRASVRESHDFVRVSDDGALLLESTNGHVVVQAWDTSGRRGPRDGPVYLHRSLVTAATKLKTADRTVQLDLALNRVVADCATYDVGDVIPTFPTVGNVVPSAGRDGTTEPFTVSAEYLALGAKVAALCGDRHAAVRVHAGESPLSPLTFEINTHGCRVKITIMPMRM